MEFFYALITGICLSASTGFRIFIPYLILSVFVSFGILPGGEIFWSPETSLIIFGLAAAAEISGYYNPWMGNMLDLVTSPMSIISGMILMNLVLPEINGLLKWLIVIFAGGGTGFCTKLLNVRARLHTSVFKSGRGDYIFASIELAAGAIIAALAWLNPLLSLLTLIVYVSVVTGTLKVEERTKRLA